MANPRWIGNALPVAQVTAWLFGGTWEATDLTDVVINGKTITVAAGSVTISAVVDALVTSLNTSTITEFAEITWSRSSNSLVATGDTAGVPFNVLLTTRDVGGAADAQTIDGATVDQPGVDSTACSGPNFWSVAANWSPAAVPVNGDNVYLENSNVSILYGLAQSAVLLASLNQSMTFTGNIGNPKTNPAGYSEYRADYLAIGATSVILGIGSQGTGSGRIKIDFGSVQTTVQVLNAGTSAEFPLETIQLKGTHADNSFTFKGNQTTAVLAPFGGEAATAATLHVNGAAVRCEAGVTFPAAGTIENLGGNLSIRSAVGGTITMTNANTQIRGSGTILTMALWGGLLDHQGTGTITAAAVGGIFDRSNDTRDLTITTTTMHPGGQINDPTQSITHTNLARASTVRSLQAA